MKRGRGLVDQPGSRDPYTGSTHAHACTAVYIYIYMHYTAGGVKGVICDLCSSPALKIADRRPVLDTFFSIFFKSGCQRVKVYLRLYRCYYCCTAVQSIHQYLMCWSRKKSSRGLSKREKVYFVFCTCTCTILLCII